MERHKTSTQSTLQSLNLWALTGEIGFKIAVPLVLFLLLGIKLDRMLQTEPLFILCGVVAAFFTSAILIARMIQAVNRRNQDDNKKKER